MWPDDRKAARRRLVAKLPIAELHRLGDKLANVVDDLKSTNSSTKPNGQFERSSWRWAVDARVARRATRLNQAVDAAGALYLSERLHAVRIAVKKLRYALELATKLGRRA